MGKIIYLQFNYNLETWKRVDKNTFQANLLKTDVWEKVIKEAENSMIHSHHPGVMVFASALNLLLFSPSYRKNNIARFEKILSQDKSRTYLFSVSTSAFREEIEKWEKVVDNLFFVKTTEAMKLCLSINKINHLEISPIEIQVPLKKEVLKEIKKVAEDTRQREIPDLIKI